jgi:hypothetical protein
MRVFQLLGIQLNELALVYYWLVFGVVRALTPKLYLQEPPSETKVASFFLACSGRSSCTHWPLSCAPYLFLFVSFCFLLSLVVGVCGL